jgi:hypothetical protein
VVGCTGVDDPVRRWWSKRHGAVGSGEGGRVPAASERGPRCRGGGPCRRELGGTVVVGGTMYGGMP